MVGPELDIMAKIGKLEILDQVLIFLGWLLQRLLVRFPIIIYDLSLPICVYSVSIFTTKGTFYVMYVL